jgi:hypothetical protein
VGEGGSCASGQAGQEQPRQVLARSHMNITGVLVRRCRFAYLTLGAATQLFKSRRGAGRPGAGKSRRVVIFFGAGVIRSLARILHRPEKWALIGVSRIVTRSVSEEGPRFLANASGYDGPLLAFCATLRSTPKSGLASCLSFLTTSRGSSCRETRWRRRSPEARCGPGRSCPSCSGRRPKGRTCSS